MRSKAKSSLEGAKTLVNCANYNGAANRAYYALYQALVWRWEEEGIRAEDVDRSAKEKMDAGIGVSWSHAFIVKNLSKMRLTAKQEQIIRYALELRVKADYKAQDVGVEIERIIAEIPGIFKQLKLDI